MITTQQATLPVIQLGGGLVEIELEVAGALRKIRGNGVYDGNDPDLGKVFKISISDPCGDFEILLPA